MAKEARIGEMRTKIVVASLDTSIDADGFFQKVWTPVFPGPAYCLWVNAHGTEAYENMRLGLKETATLTMRYTPLVNERCRIWRAEDPQTDETAYEVICIDNVQERRKLMEIKIRRLVKA